jgi:hypothetical protein
LPLDLQATGHAEVNEQRIPVVEVKHDPLPSARYIGDGAALQCFG